MQVDHRICSNLPCCYSNMHVFFSEIPSFEELQDPGSSPRRGEVGRRTLGDYGGLLLSFFYRARFQSFQLLKPSPTKKREQEASIGPEGATADFLPTRATI